MRKTALLMPAPMYHDAPTADLLLSRLKPVAGGVRRVAGARPEGCRSAPLLMALAALATGIPAVATGLLPDPRRRVRPHLPVGLKTRRPPALNRPVPSLLWKGR